MIREAAREFAQSEIAPVAAELDLKGEYPHETITKAGELGFMGVEVPDDYGGSGLDSISYAIVMEEISAADAAHGTLGGWQLLHDQCEEILDHERFGSKVHCTVCENGACGRGIAGHQCIRRQGVEPHFHSPTRG